jgi:hypothetical protein
LSSSTLPARPTAYPAWGRTADIPDDYHGSTLPCKHCGHRFVFSADAEAGAAAGTATIPSPQKLANHYRAALREIRSAVLLPTTAGLTATVRAVQTLANRARRLEEALAAVRAELEPVLNGWLFVPPDGFRCLLCGEEAERRHAAGCRSAVRAGRSGAGASERGAGGGEEGVKEGAETGLLGRRTARRSRRQFGSAADRASGPGFLQLRQPRAGHLPFAPVNPPCTPPGTA